MAGATAANEMDGVSFAPLLAGEESRYPPREFFYWEQGGLGLNVQSALLDERYFALRMEPSQPTQLFDIFADPGCKQDLAEDHPGQIERAQTLFISQHDDNPWYVNLTDALREHKSIGRNRRRTGEGHGHSC